VVCRTLFIRIALAHHLNGCIRHLQQYNLFPFSMAIRKKKSYSDLQKPLILLALKKTGREEEEEDLEEIFKDRSENRFDYICMPRKKGFTVLFIHLLDQQRHPSC